MMLHKDTLKRDLLLGIQKRSLYKFIVSYRNTHQSRVTALIRNIVHQFPWYANDAMLRFDRKAHTWGETINT